MRQEPYIDMDVHGLTADQAIGRIEAQIKKQMSAPIESVLFMDTIAATVFKRPSTESWGMG